MAIAQNSLGTDGRLRVVVDQVRPEIDGGRFPVKRVIGDLVIVEAAVFADGHDQISCRLLHRHETDESWRDSPMEALGNDIWRGEFRTAELGKYRYTVEGWVDHFKSWRGDLIKRMAAGESGGALRLDGAGESGGALRLDGAGQDLAVEMLTGTELVHDVAQRANTEDAAQLRRWADLMRQEADRESAIAVALGDELAGMVDRYPDLRLASRYERELGVVVEREKARFSTWYELFPRSCAAESGGELRLDGAAESGGELRLDGAAEPGGELRLDGAAEPGRHGTFEDCEAWLPYIASMGFDVVYLPPIHPIGRSYRKGKNNSMTCQPDDVGSPWAIGTPEGGHCATHPQLGNLTEFRRLLLKAQELGLEVALDIAFQCSPDHLYAHEHPEWFRMRPDGTIQYAENPPKKYQDIYPLDFETDEWQELWQELKGILSFWISQGVRIFRVDNPHTKAFAFWEWVINQIKEEYPDVLFLAEAFTRPHLMYCLAKLGFSQSYTYFTWRNTKDELTAYFRELTGTELREYFRPNLWPNTPDILSEYLQLGGRSAFMVRLVLAATLGANYGIYGPAFELCDNTPKETSGEEYLNSEKYQIKHWDRSAPHSLKDLIARINHIRRNNRALQSDRNLHFHETDNPSILCYSKATDDLTCIIIVVVNLDAFHPQTGWVNLDLAAIGLNSQQAFQAHDLLSDGRYLWQGPRNYVELTPESLPAHVFRVRRWLRTEKDFDYYL
jgi:starch synthase (maltosyl-transferring)